jgi:ABC-type xylose transport system permease subunit
MPWAALAPVNLTDPLIVGLANTRLPVAFGWIIGVVFVGAYVLSLLGEQRRRAWAGVQSQPVAALIGQIALVAAAVFVAIAIMSINRSPKGFNPVQGVLSAVLIFRLYRGL